jgi:heavy metal translocating P-type ATPase
MSTNPASCFLCSLNVGSFPVLDQDKHFCCKGCHTVYQILQAQNNVEDYENSTVYQQALKYGLISNKKLLNEPIYNLESQTKKIIFEIEGMWCSTCKDLIEILLTQIKGVKSVFVDYCTDLCSIEYDPMQLSKESVFSKIESFGYKVFPLESKAYQDIKKRDTALYLRLSIASFAALNIMMLSYPIYEDYFGISTYGYNYLFAWISLFLSLPIMGYCLKPIWKKFILGLRCFRLSMESLIIIGVTSSFLLSLYQLLKGSDQVYFDSLSMIVVFVLWGKVIETKAKRSTKDRLFQLYKQIPKKARVRDEDGQVAFKPLKEVKPLDHIVCLTGEKVVLDGRVIEGQASVDESLLTGEATPIYKTFNSNLISGSILQSGYLVYEVTHLFEETLFSKISCVLGEDLANKKNTQPFVDTISKFFVPFIVLLALFTALGAYFFGGLEEGFLRFLAILLISCPCALAISIPLVESLLILKLSEIGVLVRDKEALKKLPSVDTFIFDKTGTLTEGKFKVVSQFEMDEEDKMALKGLASTSNHPIAVAIMDALFVMGKKFDEVKEVIGNGVIGKIGEDEYILGSLSFLQDLSIEITNISENAAVYFVKNKKILQPFFLDDTLREGLKEDISNVKVKQKVILSGDREDKVKEIANYLSISCFKSLCTPFEKRNFIEKLQKNNQKVAMVGDGINDSLSLSLADVSISFVSGSELSCHVSHLLLMGQTLNPLEKIRILSIKAQRLIKQNLFWAFFYNIIGLLLAIFGFFPPIVAAVAMISSSILVILNSKRL